MALQVLLGIPWLAGIIGALFSSLVTFFATYLTKRLAILTAVVTALLALTLTFLGVLEGALAALRMSVPSEFSNAFFIAPSNLSTGVSIIATSRVTRWAYDWNKSIVQMNLF